MKTVSWIDALYRAGSNTERDVQLDYLWLAGFILLLVATGIGLRDPWPADEPRFALVARDMVASGEWLLPRIGGELYADKPPLFFWLIALGMEATGSLRIAFLLPSLLSALGCVLLIYDLGRRLWNRETGLAAGMALLFTVQFVWQARQAQIDATLCFFTTLSLYGLLRHLLQGPAWHWYGIGWAAAGLGVITKGVGFLPLLVLIPYAMLRSPAWMPRFRGPPSVRWLIGPPALLLAAGVWLVPMLLTAYTDPAVAAYRDEILFQQTLTRYANAWHHHKPFWYFLVDVIPALWLPLTVFLPWLAPRWRNAWRECDLRVALPLCWISMVVLFFSFSSGKRGVYVLPAVPAMALVCAPYLVQLLTKKIVQRILWAIAAAGAISMIFGFAVAAFLIPHGKRMDVLSTYGIDPVGPLILIALLTALLCAWAGPRRGALAFCGMLIVILLTVSFWINPSMNAARSGVDFVNRIEQLAHENAELGFVAFKEQYLLNIRRPIVHFGHARWREADQEMADAARWLNGDKMRQLVVSEEVRLRCFEDAQAISLGVANRTHWYLVSGTADPQCAARGQPNVARYYIPPVQASYTAIL
ncbi:ArnT family glycosyltransferase [Steroidobacter denitrificans]|uniref:ArnT family glycosyltransferase n=1 Tax=Steroidobacter denitrificans TaxID=465721 RepID=UPI0008372FEC|nr:glycosyltransferase family 39 protein [Steroidobacter denitrificans]